MKNGGKIIVILLFLVSIGILGAFVFARLGIGGIADLPIVGTTTTTPDASSISASIEASISSSKAEEERLAAEAAERLRLIAENTVYVPKGTEIFRTAELVEGDVVHTATERMALYSVGLKADVYEVKYSYDATETLGFVPASLVKKSPADFIEYPQDGVDYGHFPKSADYPDNPRIKAKAIYVTISTVTGSGYDELIQLVEQTDLNAMVIDVKDDNEWLLFHSKAAEKYNPVANKTSAIDEARMKELVKKAKDKGIYLIARIVTFKSPVYSDEHLDSVITYAASGQPYTEDGVLLWTSPYHKGLWEYNVALAEEAADYGFNEIQFDYVRFPTPSSHEINYKNDGTPSKTAAIQNFLKFAYDKLSKKHVYVAMDIFGWSATTLDDAGIGQHWEAMANVVDYVCPMIYPSHYSPGNFGLNEPDIAPYEAIDGAIKDCLSRNANIQEPGVLRPWIQYFTASYLQYSGRQYLHYGRAEVQAQIKALQDNGIEEYLLWNPSNTYELDVLQ